MKRFNKFRASPLSPAIGAGGKQLKRKGYEMSNHLKSKLLMASAMFAVSGTAAYAQVQMPAAELHGMGASSIAVVLPRELNCIGPVTGPNIVGDSNGTASALSAEGSYAPAVGTVFNCATTTVQPLIGGKYVSTGSGAGRTAFVAINTATALTGGATTSFPTAAFGTIWANPHFIFTDSAISAGNISTYNTNASTKKSGALIQVPFYVLPIAVAYNPVYGRKVSTSTDLKFNVGTPAFGYDGTTVAGGLRMTKAVYCSIFNGYITNWNNARIQALNVVTVGKKVGTVGASLMDPNDSTTRWATDGVPIRLIGRLDNSGTTDIFSRHLSAACGGGIMGAANNNKFLNNAQALPYSFAATRNISTSSVYKTGTFAASSYAGTSNLISGAVFTAGVLSQGTEAAGLYAVANLSDGVAAAIEAAPNVASASDSDYLLNGKIGYVGADYVRPALSQTLHAAALEVGNSSQTKKPLYLLPTADNATLAFGTLIVAPEGDKGGKFVTDANGFKRENPADWYEALYSGNSTLANAPVGYPLTGTTQLVTGTCFADPAIRNAMVHFMTASLGRLTIGDTAATAADRKKQLVNMFTGTKVGTLGIKAQMGIAPLPKAWSVALYETFLVRSKLKNGTVNLVDKNLYIQAGIPTLKGTGNKTKTILAAADLATTVSTVIKGKTIFNEAGPNGSCTTGLGL
jgi:ABC-type phosphate transport system substrate-binding protein